MVAKKKGDKCGTNHAYVVPLSNKYECDENVTNNHNKLPNSIHGLPCQGPCPSAMANVHGPCIIPNVCVQPP